MNLLKKIVAAAGLLTLALGSVQAQNKELVVGSSTTFEARQLIAVHKDSTTKSLKDLAAEKIGVVTGSTG